ncbi:hypothetical protein [Escherichia albertii]|uniref:hypothetical protein n=1 Tax=Escherichia albertii TaxID=208962 RepID=UPI000A7A7061|nr:hypothetical protein [Escherichia albertii]
MFGRKRRVGVKSCRAGSTTGKTTVTCGEYREKLSPSPQCASEGVVVENDALSLPSGMVSYGQAVASWNQYSDANNLTPEQKQAGLDKLAKGELPEGANISKVIVDGYKDAY